MNILELIPLPVSKVNDGNPGNDINPKLDQVPKVLQKSQFLLLQSTDDFVGEVNHGEKIQNRGHEDQHVES